MASQIGILAGSAEKLAHSLRETTEEKLSLEKQIKRLAFESNEKSESDGRLIHQLSEEIGFLKSKLKEPHAASEPRSEQQLKETLKALEAKFKEVRDKYSSKSKAFDELEFEHQQVKNTVSNLKGEIQRLSESSMNDKKEMHKSEMALFETKNRLSEVSLHLRELEDKQKSVLSELEFDRTDIMRLEEALKQEKRRVVNLEREIEQSQYLNLSKDSQQSEALANYTQQNVLLRDENASLKLRLEKLMNESQARVTKDQKELQAIQKRLKDKEASHQDLEIRVDDLRKKLDFYKQKSESSDKSREADLIKQKTEMAVKKLKEQLRLIREEIGGIQRVLVEFSLQYLEISEQAALLMKAKVKEAVEQRCRSAVVQKDYSSKSLFQGLSYDTSNGMSKSGSVQAIGLCPAGCLVSHGNKEEEAVRRWARQEETRQITETRDPAMLCQTGHERRDAFEGTGYRPRAINDLQRGQRGKPEEVNVQPFTVLNKALEGVKCREGPRYAEEEYQRQRPHLEEVTQKKETRVVNEGRDLQYSPVSPFLRSPSKNVLTQSALTSNPQRTAPTYKPAAKEKSTPMKQARPLESDKENLNQYHSPYVMDVKLRQKLSLYGYSPIESNHTRPHLAHSPYEQTYKADFQKIEKESELISERIKALRQNETRLFK